MLAIGRLEPDRASAVQAHLDGCSACRGALRELRATARALPPDLGGSLVDGAFGADPAPPARIVDAVLEQVRRDTRARARRRAVVAVAGVAAAGVLFLAGLLTGQAVLGPSPEQVSREIAFDLSPRASGAQVGATLTARPWGTQVTVTAAGLPAGRSVTVWLVDAAGQRVPCGTFTQPRGRTATVDLASALPFSDAESLGLSGADGAVLAVGALTRDR